MDRLDLIESVKTELGYPVITLYVSDEQINTMISKAIRKCSGKASPTFTVNRTVVGGKISIADLGVETVRNVYSESTSGGSLDLFGLGVPMPVTQSTLMNMAELAGKRSELEKLMLYDYYIDKEYLYVDNFSGNVTLEYVKKDLNFEDLDVEWRGWVEGYVTAMVKIIEGRIRGKYKITSGAFEVESDQLISEGKSDMQDLESKLDASIGYYNILR